jgi:transcriptional accessory protein Tex/SPT6
VASSAASALAGARLRAASATASNLSRLNPLLRGIDDLRPGMEVAGTISSISSFGAFVSIGLDVEGLIHVSELAEQFVSDPSQVVTLGQPLTARVLEIDRSRRRVSLSLRKGERPRGGGKGREQSRARALSEIERLFRK